MLKVHATTHKILIHTYVRRNIDVGVLVPSDTQKDM